MGIRVLACINLMSEVDPDRRCLIDCATWLVDELSRLILTLSSSYSSVAPHPIPSPQLCLVLSPALLLLYPYLYLLLLQPFPDSDPRLHLLTEMLVNPSV